MRKFATVLVMAAAMAGSVLTAQTASAAQTNPDPHVYIQPAVPKTPGVQMLDCVGGTGGRGCGPGWFWRDGWRGWACYQC
jgi:hypothetical protein